MLTPLPGATPTKPGACMQPFFGIRVSLRNPMDGTVITGPGEVRLGYRGCVVAACPLHTGACDV